MKIFTLALCCLLGFALAHAQPQDANYQIDNGQPQSVYQAQTSWDETQYFGPTAPGTLEKVYVYLYGESPARDTLRIVADPGDNYLPATWWVTSLVPYASYAQIPFDYNGTAGWYEFDVSEYNIRLGGMNRVGVQHLIKSGGPYFVFDSDGRTENFGSFLVDVFKPNTNFYNIRGTLINVAGGDFLIRLKVDWDYGSADAPRPKAFLNDVTNEKNLTNSNGEPFKAVSLTVKDFDGDGWEDVVTTNAFLKNTGGQFEDVSEQYSGVPNGNRTFADIDGDGMLDVLVTSGASLKIAYRNSEGAYDVVTPENMNIDEPIMTALLLDYNLDGQLDIFIARNRRTVNGQEVYYYDQLFRNNGNRQFEDQSIPSGIRAGEATATDCYGANIIDYNNDNLPDIFVATYRLAHDLLYRNNGDGTFTEVARETGAYGIPTANQNYSGHGMGSDWIDFDNNGFIDLAVGNLSHPDERGAVANPSYVLQQENGEFNYSRSSSPLFFEMNAAPLWTDINNDGLPDLFSAQYAYYKKGDQNQPDKNSRIYLNQGQEMDFAMKDMTWESGMRVHGAWTGYRIDIDNDGDLDLIVASNQDEVKLYENTFENQGDWVRIDPNIEGESHVYGKSLVLETDKGQYLRQLMGSVSSGRDGKQSDILHFGIGDEKPVAINYTDIEGNTHRADLTEGGFYRLDELFPTSVDNESHGGALSLFPNPARDFITVQGEISNENEYMIIDMQGKTIISGEMTREIDVTALNSGTYILKIGNQELSFVISK